MLKIPEIKISFKKTLLDKAESVNFAYNNLPNDSFEKSPINKDILVEKGIIDKNTNLNYFFDDISSKIFKDENAQTLSKLLKNGYVTLSTSCYRNIKNPHSGIAIELDKNKSINSYCAKTEEYIENGIGIGINFSNLKNPTEAINKLNSYMKYREPFVKRPPAAIGILNIDHPKIIDFITLKNNCEYDDWCFDLSVVVPDDFFNKVDNNEEIELTNGQKINARTLYNILLSSMLLTGEPGVIFSNKKDYICDCCGATPLKANEKLTLAHINLSKYTEGGKINTHLLKESASILAKAMKNIDPNGYIGVLGYQEFLDNLNLNWGEKRGNEALEECMKIISLEAYKNNIKTGFSPTSVTSKILGVTPSIEARDKENLNYYSEIDTLASAQKYLTGGISKTIILKPKHTVQDIDAILRYAFQKHLKGITVFKP